MKRNRPKPQEKPEVIYTKYQLDRLLKEKWKRVAQEYCTNGWKKTEAYMKVYKTTKYDSAAVCAHKLLKKVKIKQYIEFIKEDYEMLCGINKARQIQEYIKIAYSNISRYHDTWIDFKEFQAIPEEEKAAIETTETQTKLEVGEDKVMREIVYKKIKLFPKLVALQRIDKLMGYELAEKVEHSGKIDTNITVDISTYSEEQQKALLDLARKNEATN